MLELLKGAARVAQPTGETSLPQDILSFSLEYATAPDLAAERARIADILGGDRFDLFPYSEESPDILILQFPGVAIQQSPEYLFEEAQSLAEALDIVSVTPEIEPPYQDLLSLPPEAEGVGDFFWELCQSNAAAQTDPDWARKLIRADRAASRFGVSGSGVRVAQPDTGVAEHRELDQGVNKALGHNYLDNNDDPTDPLLPSMNSAGHGTGTSSLVTSRPTHTVTGSGFGCTLVPLRAVNSVVIGMASAVARSIDHARLNHCHVVTMSLGGPIPSPQMRRALEKAVAADLIVLAAAGNCVGIVTFPAWNANVIAVAAVNHAKQRWRGSCHGAAVDIAAPGENVYVARRTVGSTDFTDINARGQGTSFAVALTAGVASLWIERFGHGALVAEAHRRGLKLQELFRAALKQTAEVPPGWDKTDMGAGIVNAEALLDLPLNQIHTPGPQPEGNPALVAFGRDFEGTRFAAEAGFVATDWQIRQRPESVPALERALPARPSPQFARELQQEPPTDLPSPALILAPATPPVPIDDALKRLAAGRQGTLESAGGVDFDDALTRIQTEGTEPILETARARFAERASRAADRVDTAMQDEALDRMGAALDSLTRPEETPRITATETRVVLEALVKLTGRPAIRVRGDGSEVLDPLLGDWASDLVPTRNRWQRLTNAVGRIDVKLSNGEWAHAGTGFLIVDGHIMTNRHVLDTFAEPLPAPSGEQRFTMRREASIIFDPEAKDETTRYTITEVVTAGKNRIGRVVNLGSLDMAVVRIDPSNGHGPPPPAIDRETVSFTDPSLSKMLVTGYPAKPSGSSGPDAQADAQKYLAFWDRIGELYGDDYGVKYMSPGNVMTRPGAVAGDPKGWAFTHDATTMPGNSGSAIITLDARTQFCGLHFGGETLTQNLAHDIERAFAVGDGVFSTAFLGAAGG